MKKDLIRYTNFGIYTLLFRMLWRGDEEVIPASRIPATQDSPFVPVTFFAPVPSPLQYLQYLR